MRQVQTIRTPTGPLALIRPTAEKLLAEGLISGTLASVEITQWWGVHDALWIYERTRA